MDTQHLVINADRMPWAVAVGNHVDFEIRAWVRKIEAEAIDITGYDKQAGTALLQGEVYVELAIENVTARPVRP